MTLDIQVDLLIQRLNVAEGRIKQMEQYFTDHFGEEGETIARLHKLEKVLEEHEAWQGGSL